MSEQNRRRTILTCLVAVMMTIGFTAAPVAAADDGVSLGGDDGISIDADEDGVGVGVGGDDGVSVDADEEDGVSVDADEEDGVSVDAGGDDGVSVDADDDDDISIDDDALESTQNDSDDDPESPVNYSDVPLEDVPVDLCRDWTGEAQDTVPFEDVPWFDDLPEEIPPPPGVPTDLITPESAAAIAFGFVPNQCAVQDPYDPSFDPTEDDIDPDGDAEVRNFDVRDDGAAGQFNYHLTLDEDGEGPGVSGRIVSVGSTSLTHADFDLTVNDGEKDYGVDPRVQHFEDGTAFGETDVVLFGQRLGVEIECDGEECEPGLRGLPSLVDEPAIPAPTGEDDDGSDDEDAGPFPEEFCTDLGEETQENVPFEDVPWFDDLPEEIPPPPGVPTDLITPESAAAIAFGFVPNQCTVQDPNDPSFDPTEDDIDPDGDAEVRNFDVRDDGAAGQFNYHLTLDEDGEGPGVSGRIVSVGSTSLTHADFDLTVNDGEKDYGVDPRVQHFEDGTTFGETDVVLFGQRLGVEIECDGEECEVSLRGLPSLVDLPTVPDPIDGGGD